MKNTDFYFNAVAVDHDGVIYYYRQESINISEFGRQPVARFSPDSNQATLLDYDEAMAVAAGLTAMTGVKHYVVDFKALHKENNEDSFKAYLTDLIDALIDRSNGESDEEKKGEQGDEPDENNESKEPSDEWMSFLEAFFETLFK